MSGLFGMVMAIYCGLTTLAVVWLVYGKTIKQVYSRVKNYRETQEKQKQTQLKRLVRKLVREYLEELQS